MARRKLLLSIVTALSTTLAAQSGSVPCSGAGDQNKGGVVQGDAAYFAQRNPRYQLRPGDSFDIHFEFVPEFNQTVTVQPDGFVTLREIGDMHVTGQTVPELTRHLCSGYGKIMASPSIAVLLKDFERPYFTVGGQVARPGKYDLRSDTTIVEALAIAGGLTERSKHSQVLLFRQVSSQWSEARLLDVKKMLASKNLAEDLHLRPGDMIFVPQNWMSKINQFLPRSAVSTYFRPTQY